MSTNFSTSKKLNNLNKQIIALFSGNSSIVTIPKLYIELTGSHTLASVLNQCVYWSNKSNRKDGYFYKTYSEWYRETHIPERTLRRKFDRLEQCGWITTKVKKIHGINTKHIIPNIDRIKESIAVMLNINLPNMPPYHDGNETEQIVLNPTQNNCTNIAPTGHFVRLEPATLSDSYNTDDNLHMKNTSTDVSSSISFSETLDQNILSEKLYRDERSDDEFMENVIEHVDNHSDKKYPRIVRAQGALKLLKRLKEQNIIFYAKGRTPKETIEENKQIKKQETDEERQIRQFVEYQHEREKSEPGYKSPFLENERKLEHTKEGYKSAYL